MVKETNKDIRDEAVKWFVRWSDQSEPSGTRTQLRWFSWLQRSPNHVAEYFAVDDMYTRLSESHTLQDMDVDAWLAKGRAEVLSLNRGRPVQGIERVPVRRRGAGRVWSALIAASLVVAVALWQFLKPDYSYRTAVGQQMAVRLNDGSSLLLNTKSQAQVRFDEKAREVELKGEALFTVAADSARPFLVHTSDVTIQALGTRFNVYEEGQATRVAVLEGRVRVTSPVLKKSFELGAGEMASVTHSAVEKTLHPDLKVATAWQTHSLVFERTRLADVAREFNRYNPIQFRVDPTIDGSYRLSGTFDAVHPESLLLWLQSRPDLEVKQEGHVYSIREVTRAPAEGP